MRTRDRLGMTIAPLMLRVVLGVTFLWAGAGKLVDKMPVEGERAARLANLGVNLRVAGSPPPTEPEAVPEPLPDAPAEPEEDDIPPAEPGASDPEPAEGAERDPQAQPPLGAGVLHGVKLFDGDVVGGALVDAGHRQPAQNPDDHNRNQTKLQTRIHNDLSPGQQC